MMEREIFDNTAGEYLISAGTFLAIMIGVQLARRFGGARLRALAPRPGTWESLMAGLLDKVRVHDCALLALFIATRHLQIPERIDRLAYAAVLLALTYRAVIMLRVAVDYLIGGLWPEQARAGEADAGAARGMSYLAGALLWILAVLFVLSNLGFNVSSMLAGLGIGGVAVALAAQAVLGDLFSALAIYLDRPFVPGDFIVAGDMQGTVERIGIKTTRVRALSGEMLIIANSRLTSAQIQNFRQLQERRIVMGVGVPYHTAAELVRRIPGLLRAAVAAAPKARFGRAHLKCFDENGFSFELVYFVTDPDYGVYMDANEAIHFAVLEAFLKEGVSFAMPATVFHAGPGATAAPAA